MWPAFSATFLCRAIFRGYAEIFIFRRHICICICICICVETGKVDTETEKSKSLNSKAGEGVLVNIENTEVMDELSLNDESIEAMEKLLMKN